MAALVAAALLVAACSSASSGPPTSTPLDGASIPASQVATPSASTPPSPTAPPIALFGPLPSQSLEAAKAARLQAVLGDLVAAGAPDAIAAMITPDGIWAGAAGIGGPDGRKATPFDGFDLDGPSKTILAAAVLRLAQDGRIDLDAPLANYLGDLGVDSNGATVRQALAMESGIGATQSDVFSSAEAHCDRTWTREDVAATIPKPFAKAGSRYLYSQPTYKLLGFAVEQVTSQGIADAIEDLVIGPTERSRLVFQIGRAAPKPWALPLVQNAGTQAPEDFGAGGALPCVGIAPFGQGAAGAAGDAPTLARWAWRLFSGGTIAEPYLQLMVGKNPHGEGMGLERIGGYDRIYARGASRSGYSDTLVIDVTAQVVVVVFENVADADLARAAMQLIDATR
jgi:D-alanyl-D-alanine carboxypeptidase